MEKSEQINKEICTIHEEIEYHKLQIKKLEKEENQLISEFQDLSFEEKHKGQFASRFEISAEELKYHND